MSARDDYPLTTRLAEHQPAGNRQREATAILDELDRQRRYADLLAAALLTRGVTGDQCDALDQWLRE